MTHYTFVGPDNTTLSSRGWTGGSPFSGWIQGNEAMARDQGDRLKAPDGLTFLGDGTFSGIIDIQAKGLGTWDIVVGAVDEALLLWSAIKFHYINSNKLEFRWVHDGALESIIGSVLDAALTIGQHTFSYDGAQQFTFDGVPYATGFPILNGMKFHIQLVPNSAFIAGLPSVDADPGAAPPPPPPPPPPIIEPAPTPFFGGAMGGAGVSGAQGNDPQWARKFPNLCNHRWKY